MYTITWNSVDESYKCQISFNLAAD